MSSWSEVESAAPALAGAVRARFEQHGLALLATLRADGWPRLSGIETVFAADQLWLGMMTGSRKAADLHRDGRLALHAATIDKDVVDGDAKLTATARAATDEQRASYLASQPSDGSQPPQEFELFWLDITELSMLRVDIDHLVIESWAVGKPVRRVERY